MYAKHYEEIREIMNRLEEIATNIGEGLDVESGVILTEDLCDSIQAFSTIKLAAITLNVLKEL